MTITRAGEGEKPSYFRQQHAESPRATLAQHFQLGPVSPRFDFHFASSFRFSKEISRPENCSQKHIFHDWLLQKCYCWLGIILV